MNKVSKEVVILNTRSLSSVAVNDSLSQSS